MDTQPSTPDPSQLSAQGQSAYKHGDYLTAAQDFEAAEAAYQATGDRLNAAEMANNASVAYLQDGDAQAAWNKAMGTDAIFAEANDVKRQAMALGNQASALEALGKTQEAEAAYQQSAELFASIGEADLRSVVFKSLSALQMRRGGQLEALASMNAALAVKEKLSLRERLMKKLLQVPFKMFNR